MPEQPTPTTPRARPGGLAARLLGAVVAAHALLVLGASSVLAQTTGPTTSTVAGAGGRGRLNGPFIVVAVVGGLLLLLYQRRTFRKMERTFDPDADRPERPEE
jgi:hypothetical protein